MYFYCAHCQTLPLNSIHKIHHDTIYGIGVSDDNALFGRLILEINQAGLSWNTILVKENNFFNAYSEFNIQKIANYDENDVDRLISDTGIVRNRLKINAAIFNAKRILGIQKEFGSFYQWIKIQQATDINQWVKIFKKEFKFVGGEIVNEFLMTIGRVEGSHKPECNMYPKYLEGKKIWGD